MMLRDYFEMGWVVVAVCCGYEDEYTLEFDQECGEAIVFEFDEKGILTKIYS